VEELPKAKPAEIVDPPRPGEGEAVEAGDGPPTERLGPSGVVDAKPPDATAAAEMRPLQAGHVGVPLGVPMHPEIHHLDQRRPVRTEVDVNGGPLETLDPGKRAADRHGSARFVRPRHQQQQRQENHDHKDALQPYDHFDVPDSSVNLRDPIEAAAITCRRPNGRRWEGQDPAP